jgi:hypothetical protein
MPYDHHQEKVLCFNMHVTDANMHVPAPSMHVTAPNMSAHVNMMAILACMFKTPTWHYDVGMALRCWQNSNMAFQNSNMAFQNSNMAFQNSEHGVSKLDDDPSFIVLTETKFSFRCIPVWDRYSPHRTRVEKKAHVIMLSP